MLETFLLILHIAVSLFLVFVVLLQSGQAADLAGAFGGGGSQTALGMRGAATLLQKVTTASAVIFMVTSLALGIVGRFETSVIEGLEGAVEDSAPVDAADQAAAPGEAQQRDSGQQGSDLQQGSDPQQGSGQEQG